MLNTTVAINGGLYEKQKSITVNFAPVCRFNDLGTKKTAEWLLAKTKSRLPSC